VITPTHASREFVAGMPEDVAKRLMPSGRPLALHATLRESRSRSKSAPSRCEAASAPSTPHLLGAEEIASLDDDASCEAYACADGVATPSSLATMPARAPLAVWSRNQLRSSRRLSLGVHRVIRGSVTMLSSIINNLIAGFALAVIRACLARVCASTAPTAPPRAGHHFF